MAKYLNLVSMTALLVVAAATPVHAGITSGLTELCNPWEGFFVFNNGEVIYAEPQEGLVYWSGSDLFYNSTIPLIVPDQVFYPQPDEVFDEYSGVWHNASEGEFRVLLCEPEHIVTPAEVPEFGFFGIAVAALVGLFGIGLLRRS